MKKMKFDSYIKEMNPIFKINNIKIYNNTKMNYYEVNMTLKTNYSQKTNECE